MSYICGACDVGPGMHWCPITICSDLDGVGASGIYLYDQETSKELVLSICGRLADSLIDGAALGALSVTVEHANWEDLKLLRQEQISSSTLDLFRREFVVPEDLAVLVFGFVNKNPSRHLAAKTQFSIRSAAVGSAIEMQTTPFGNSHINLFHAYCSRGTVVLSHGKLLLVDARYLDGMEGGCVYSSNHPEFCIGLVLGQLRHRLRRGEFMIVLPFSEMKFPKITQAATNAETETLSGPNFEGVVAVKIQETPRFMSWGSGVLIGPRLVATNFHVVRDKPIEATLVLLNAVPVEVEKVTRPLMQLDLAFLYLKQDVPHGFTPVKLAKTGPSIGTPVRSVGFGLLAPGKYGDLIQPLQSHGAVNQAVNGMLICSSGCWNGSSGGGVFNSDNELVGIMASNATDKATATSMPDIAFVIPVDVIHTALGGGEQYEMAERLFKLDRTNADRRVK